MSTPEPYRGVVRRADGTSKAVWDARPIPNTEKKMRNGQVRRIWQCLYTLMPDNVPLGPFNYYLHDHQQVEALLTQLFVDVDAAVQHYEAQRQLTST